MSDRVVRSVRSKPLLVASATALLALTACGPEDEVTAGTPMPATTSEAAAVAAATITPDDLYQKISVLAADSMRGRDTPSPEIEQVAAWIGAEFAALGLRPGGDDGTFVQHYALRQMTASVTGSSIAVSNGASLDWGTEVMALGLPRDGSTSGPVVLVSGTGDPAGAFAELPAGAQVFMFAGPEMEATRATSWAGRTSALYEAGAGQVFLVSTIADAAWQGSLTRTARGSRVVGELDPNRPVSLNVREGAVREALAGVDVDALQSRHGDDLEVTVLEGLTVDSEISIEVLDDASAPNVVGILEGSDPTLRDEYVVYSAHMDHVGVRPTESGDSIFNGADDDASGTATIMEVAEAMASLDRAPRRSMIFLLVSGEEKGLLGSAYFADHPPVPVEQMVANINADMVGRNWPDTIVAIGKEHSDLGVTLNRVNEAHPEIGMTAIDDLWPDERFYFRSDHFNFARKGVPILFFFNGTHEDYHQASDELDKIDTEKTARIGQLIFYLGLEVSETDARPQWNPDSYAEIVEGG